MHHERADTSLELRGRAITLLVLVAATLLTWTLLQAFGSVSVRHPAPAQAPAGQEPQHRGTPALDRDLIS